MTWAPIGVRGKLIVHDKRSQGWGEGGVGVLTAKRLYCIDCMHVWGWSLNATTSLKALYPGSFRKCYNTNCYRLGCFITTETDEGTKRRQWKAFLYARHKCQNLSSKITARWNRAESERYSSTFTKYKTDRWGTCSGNPMWLLHILWKE